ncbi:MAG: DUF563 domain-containing protein [Cyanobacterium sp. T60_A2020_053]|nr:DUF563 domain-containing protein [Cyanobacterium sp. T60_A2020_053]
MPLSKIQDNIISFCQQEDYQELANYLAILGNDDLIILGYKGLSYLLENKEEESLEIWFYTLMNADSQECEIIANNLCELAKIYDQKYKFKLAIKIYTQALEFNHYHQQSYLNLGYCYIKQGDVTSALHLWEDALKNSLNYQFLTPYLGKEYQQIKEYPQAIHYYHQALQNEPDNPDILYNIGICYSKLGQFSSAVNYQKKSLDLIINSPKNIISYKFTESICHFPHTLNKKQFISLIHAELTYLYLQEINRKQVANNHQRLIENPEKLEPFTVNKKNQEDEIIAFYETTKSIANQNNLVIDYQPILNSTEINLKPPKNNRKNLHNSFFFPEKIALPPTFVVTIKQGQYWLREDEASSALLTSDKHLLGDISPESPALSPNHPDKHPRYHSLIKTKFNLPKPTVIKGKILILAGLLNNVYFHWLFDILPRLYLLERINFNYDKIDYILVDHRTKFQKETLKIWNIPENKIIPLSFPTNIKADELIVPSFPSDIAWMPPWSCDYLYQKLLKNIKQKPYRNIYITRKNASNRRLINETEIIAILQQYNFEIIDLESLSVKQQANLLNSARLVISLHGSGLSNLVFCQTETTVIEIFSPFYVYPCYWLLSNLKQLNYYYLIGEIWGSENLHRWLYPDSRKENIYLAPSLLKDILNKII